MKVREVLAALALTISSTVSATATEALIPFEQGGLWGYRDGRGTVVIAPRFFVAEPFSAEGLAAAADRDAWVYIDRAGRVLVRPFVVDNGPDPFSEGLARFVDRGRVGFFDRHGRIAIPPRFDYARSFHDGRAAVCTGCRMEREGEHQRRVGGKWGFVDRTGAAAVAAAYDEVGDYAGGRARVRLGGMWSVIDRAGRRVEAE